MKITEIQATNIIRQARRGRYDPHWIQVFDHYGWELLGHGREGYVALNPQKGYAFKIWPATSRYTNFVKFARANENPHFPRFYREPRQIPGTSFNYMAMEKLEPLQGNELLHGYFPEMLWFTLELLKRNEWSEQSGEILDLLQIVFPSLTVLPDLVPTSKFYKPDLAQAVWDRVKQPPDSWKTAVQMLDKWVVSHSYHYDLFSFNFMLRGSTLVFVDPIA